MTVLDTFRNMDCTIENNDKPFLPYNFFSYHFVAGTLYEHFKKMHLLVYNDSSRCKSIRYGNIYEDALNSLRNYSYEHTISFDNYYSLIGAAFGPVYKNRAITLKAIITNVVQYRLLIIYELPEHITNKGAHELFLLPLVSKLIEHPLVLSTLMIVNRENTNEVSIEMVLFCAEKLENDDFLHFTYSPAQKHYSFFQISKTTPMAWYTILYNQIYHNPNILTYSVQFLSFTCKPDEDFATWSNITLHLRGVLSTFIDKPEFDTTYVRSHLEEWSWDIFSELFNTELSIEGLDLKLSGVLDDFYCLAHFYELKKCDVYMRLSPLLVPFFISSSWGFIND